MVGGNFDKNDSHPVRVLYPHLHQPPRLQLRLTHHGHAGSKQPLMLGSDVPHLNPHGQTVPGRAGGLPTDLEEAAAEEEHQARVVRGAELSVDRQPQCVSIEPPASLRVGRTQQDAASQYLHASMLPCSEGILETCGLSTWSR